MTEERIYQLLAPGSTATSLEVTFAKGNKGRPQKTKVLNAMKEWVLSIILFSPYLPLLPSNGMNISEDPTNGRVIRITLPIGS